MRIVSSEQDLGVWSKFEFYVAYLFHVIFQYHYADGRSIDVVFDDSDTI